MARHTDPYGHDRVVPAGTDKVDIPKFFTDFVDSQPGPFLPHATTKDNGKIISVVNGRWVISAPTAGLPSGAPESAPGAGDSVDVDKILTVQPDGSAAWEDPAEALPDRTGVAAGAVLYVDANGNYGWGFILSDDDPFPAGTANPGTDTWASRADHVHGAELPPRGAADASRVLRVQDDGTGLEWHTPDPGLALSDDDPFPLDVTDPGTSDEASRADHVHGSPLPARSPADASRVLRVQPDGTGLEWADALPDTTGANDGDTLYVDVNGVAGWGSLLSSDRPLLALAGGDPGTETWAARADHVHPAEVTAGVNPPTIIKNGQLWYDLNSADLFVSVSGAWIDTLGGTGRGGMHVGAVPHPITTDGQTWLDTVSGHLFVSYNNQWIDMSGAS